PQLIYILRQMNVESDNKLADLLTTELGGVKIVEQQAIWSTGVPTAEIKLQNGSGLTNYNFISPRASSALFMAVQRALQGSNWNIADLFPVGGQDQGTLEERRLPKGTVVKTGTLDDVIALAGVLPTRDQGLVWFTLVNRGTDWYSLRSAQDRLLQDLTKLLGGAIAPGIQPHITMKNLVLGEPQRNQIINSLSDSNRQ
ncbi:MAG: D-alanyl-D-alanine carboxypeptidase, partial [Microcoleaceae cyanobacterium]